jgi:PAS domain S-box-containing protein
VRFDTFRRVAVFVVFAALLAPFLSSFLDAALVEWNGWGTAGFWDVWRARVFSNVLAIVTLVPAIVTWGNTDIASLRSIGWRRMLEAAALAVGLLVVCAVVFSRSSLAVHAYAPLPFLLWAAVRFGPGGASAGLLILALISTWGAIHGQGPFVGRSITDNVLALQLFLFVTYVPLMTLAAAIRERDRAERDARRSEQWLNLALGAGQVAAWDWDIGRDRAAWSENMSALLGRDGVGTGTGDLRAFLQSVVADDRPAVESAITRAIDQGAPYEIEFRTVREDGGVRWLTGKGTVVRDAAGRAVRMLGVNADITDRKAAEVALQHEAALRESETRLRVLTDGMPQIVFASRPDGTVEYLNRRWYEFTGRPTIAIDEDPWIDAVHPSDRVAALKAWSDAVMANRPHEDELRIWSAQSRTYRWHLVRMVPVRDASGTIVRWYGTSTDIDDRRQAEEALRKNEWNLRTLRAELETRVAKRTLELLRANETLRREIEVRRRVEADLRASEERFAKAFRASLDAICIASQPAFRIIELNDRWESTFGYARDESVGHPIDQLHVYASEHDQERISQLMRTRGFVSEQEIDMRHKDGTALRAVLAAETVEVSGEPCVIMMVRDITERQRAEHEIAVQRNELAHLGRVTLLGELSGALAHELNQPLAAILANARAAQRMLAHDEFDRVEVRAILDDIVSDDRRAGAVIQRVRALIRKDETKMHGVMPNDLVADVLELAHSDLIQRSVTVMTRLSPTVPEVQGDRVQLQQVLLNLIVNACDAMVDNPPDHRPLIITTKAVAPDAIRLSVADGGAGITVQPIDRVFEPFVTSKRHGLGLGLAICRSIVDAHGGRMWAVNNAGTGATFHVLLPLVPAPVAPVAPETDTPAASDGNGSRPEPVEVSGSPSTA